MIHHRTFANLALVSNMLVAGPALTLIAGIISQLDQNQFSQWINRLKIFRIICAPLPLKGSATNL